MTIRANSEENSSEVSVDEVVATQNEVHDQEFLAKTQHEIKFAEIRYEGSLLQDSISSYSIKLPLPTEMEPEVVVTFFSGAKQKLVLTTNFFVKLYDRSLGVIFKLKSLATATGL